MEQGEEASPTEVINSSQVQLQMKAFSSRPECTLLFQRDTLSVRVPEEVDHTLKLG